MKKIGLFICSHDGIACHYAGIGTAARGYIQGTHKLHKDLLKENIELVCFAITGDYLPSSYAFNKDLLKKNQELCESTGGKVIFCLNNSDGTYQYGDIENWHVASASAATIVKQIIKENDFDEVIVLGLDTPFAKTPLYVKKQLFKDEIKYKGVWVPHSTSLIHERGNFNAQRINWETSTVQEINNTQNMYVSYLNSYMKSHLKKEYEVKDNKLIPLLNGINIDEVQYFSQGIIKAELEKYKIPTDKPIIMSFGRGAPYKGFDIFLKSLHYLKDLPAHFVLQVAFFDPQDPLLKELKSLAKGLDNLTFIPKLSYDLPRQLMQWKNTEITCVLSQNESGAFIPAEIRIYSQALALISDQDGLPCQVQDNIDGFITSIEDPEIVAKKIKEVFNLSLEKKDLARKKGKQKIISKYNIINNFVDGITSLRKI